eukprot:1458159-Pyramimonas_sp.AAC.1
MHDARLTSRPRETAPAALRPRPRRAKRCYLRAPRGGLGTSSRLTDRRVLRSRHPRSFPPWGGVQVLCRYAMPHA